MGTENKASLVVMAAGMGSRFGGLKQIAPIGPNGEVIVDFSAHDAVEAGFSKMVFIIKKAIEHDFREVIGKRIEKMIDVEYVFQEIDKIPAGFSIPEGREKPWGTGHALLCAKDVVKNPFVVINADDYYGKKSYKLIHDYLMETRKMCMVAYRLGNTLTENGTVTRGVCQTGDDGYLKSIVETYSVDKNSGIPLDTPVAMNLFGFDTNIFNELQVEFEKFLRNLDKVENPLKCEFLLPSVVDGMINNKNEKMKVLTTDDKWYGVTYKEDVEPVKAAIKKMIEDGLYPNL